MFTRIKLATTVENISNVQSQRTLVNDGIQVALDRVYQFFDWPYYLDSKNGVIATIADYNTGLATVINGSASVSGNASTVWTSAMVGRKIRIGSEKPYYRIIAVGGVNALTIDNPYQGTSVAGSSYEIFKDEYKLKADVDKYKMMRQLQNGISMFTLTPKRFDEILPTPQNFADPLYDVMIGTNLDTYSTGTISASGSTITGVGTAWTSVEGLGRMSKIRIGTATGATGVYTVKSVDSATQITTYETIGTVAALTTYSIYLNNLTVQLYHIPDANRLIYYRYFRLPDVLANDYDLPDMPHEFHWILVDGCLSWIWRQKGDLNNQTDAENRFLIGLTKMREKLGDFAPDRVNRRRSVDKLRRRFDGLENSNFDYRYSSPI